MSFIRLEPRGQASKTMVYVTPLLAVALRRMGSAATSAPQRIKRRLAVSG